MSSYSGCGWDLQVLNNNLDWNAAINRELSARLQKPDACRPVPSASKLGTAKYIPLGRAWDVKGASRPATGSRPPTGALQRPPSGAALRPPSGAVLRPPTGALLRTPTGGDRPGLLQASSDLGRSSSTPNLQSTLPSHWAGNPLENHPKVLHDLMTRHWIPVPVQKPLPVAVRALPRRNFAGTQVEAIDMLVLEHSDPMGKTMEDRLAQTQLEDATLRAALTPPDGNLLAGVDTSVEGMAPFAGGGRSFLESRSRKPSAPEPMSRPDTGLIPLPTHMTNYPPTGQWLL